MMARRPGQFRRAATLGLAGVGLAIVFGGRAVAQHTPDPYNIVGEYNRQYEPYMYAIAPNTGPYQGALSRSAGNRNANRFQSYLDGEGDDGIDAGRLAPPGVSRPGVPYYRANRRFDHQFKREYRPNENADRSYYDDQQQRNEKYFQALGETDARKRSQLLREYNLENLRSARSLSSGRNPIGRGEGREPDRDRNALRLPPSASSLTPGSRSGESSFGLPTLRSRARTSRSGPTAGALGSSLPPSPTGARTSRTLASPGGTRSRPPFRNDLPSESSLTPGSGRLEEPGATPAPPRSASDILRESESVDGDPLTTTPPPRRSSAPPAR